MPVIPSDAEDVKIDVRPSVTDETVAEPVTVGTEEASVDVGALVGAVPEPEKLTPVAVSDTELEIVLLRSEVEVESVELTMPLGPNVIPVDDGRSEAADVVGTGTTPARALVGRTITPGRPPVDAALPASELVWA